jgi:hypothetical protein
MDHDHAWYQQYRELINEFRQHRERDLRRESLRDQILEYKRRCEQMKTATNIGVIAAILLICVPVLSAINTILSQVAFLKYLTGPCAIVGLLLVVWAAVLVVIENTRLQLIIDSEVSDVSELEHGARPLSSA